MNSIKILNKGNIKNQKKKKEDCRLKTLKTPKIMKLFYERNYFIVT